MRHGNPVTPLWLRSYLQGFALACDHRVFTVLAILAVCGERAFSLYLSYTDKTLKELITEYGNMVTSSTWLSPSILMHGSAVAYLKLLLPFLSLFLIGWFVLAGLFGLMRDQLTHEWHNTRDVLKYGRSFFWPILKFKLPIFLIQGIALLLSAAIIVPLANQITYLFLVGIPVVFTCLAIFISCLIMLSLGTKMIIISQLFNISTIYRRIIRLIIDNFREVGLFYTLFVFLSVFGIAMPFIIKNVGISSLLLTIINIFFLSFLTVVMHASTLIFLLHLQVNSLMEISHNG